MESCKENESEQVKQLSEKVNEGKHEYCCRRCRVRLFTDDDLMVHTPKIIPKVNNNNYNSDKKRHVHKTTFKYGRDLPSNSNRVLISKDHKIASDKVDLQQNSIQIQNENNVIAEEEKEIEQEQTPELCTSYFLDPDKCIWVAAESRIIAQANNVNQADQTSFNKNRNKNLGEVLPDTIYCKHCNVKIGTQCWNGAQCSCGAWVTPAFKVNAKAVDKLRMR